MNLYGLYDPAAPGELRYVGITRKMVGARLKNHVAEVAVAAARTHKINWIASLVHASRLPAVRLLAVIEDDEAPRMEQLAIAAYRKSGQRLTNGTEGGERTVFTDHSRANMSAAARAGWACPEVRARMSAGLMAAWSRPETIAKRSAAQARSEVKSKKSNSMKTTLASPESRAKMSAVSKAAHARPEVKAKQSAASRTAWDRQGARVQRSAAMKSVWNRPGERAKRSAALKAARIRRNQ